MPSNKLVKVTLIKSLVGTRRTLRKNVTGLGLSKINSSVEIADSSANRGMINKVSFLLKVEG